MLDAVVTINQDNIIKFFNKAAGRSWVYYRKQGYLTTIISELLPPEHWPNGAIIIFGNSFKLRGDTMLNTRYRSIMVDKFGG